MPNSSSQPPEIDNGRILRFWHHVEFFLPFDLQQSVQQRSVKTASLSGPSFLMRIIGPLLDAPRCPQAAP
jgi:hypothetical protein